MYMYNDKFVASLGAVRIRLRALSVDGRDSVGEQSVEYFLQPDDFFVDLYSASPWLWNATNSEVAACCGTDSTSCVAADMSAVFCEIALSAISRQAGEKLSPKYAAQASLSSSVPRPEACAESTSGGEGVCARGVVGDEDTAGLGLLHGFDMERLFPFVESLRHTGFRGAIHLAASNPELACEEDSEWCARVLRYLEGRNVTVEPFPEEIAWGRQQVLFTCFTGTKVQILTGGRQQLHHHDSIVRLLLISRFAAGAGARHRRILVADAASTLFQRHPFAHLPPPPPLRTPSPGVSLSRSLSLSLSLSLIVPSPGAGRGSRCAPNGEV